jgi:hypothetical protein
MTELRVQSTGYAGREWATLFPEVMPPELTDRMKQTDWIALITQLNDAAKEVETKTQDIDTLFVWSVAISISLFFILIGFHYFVLLITIPLGVFAWMLYVVDYYYRRQRDIEFVYRNTVNTTLRKWNTGEIFCGALIYVDLVSHSDNACYLVIGMDRANQPVVKSRGYRVKFEG